ncbi:MAG: hypothetical protein ACP5PS_09335 [Bacteroidales bacterium]
MLEYLTPIRQFRGIGRFAWLFFYVFNIIAFYFIWKYFEKYRYKYVVWTIAFGSLFYDAWYNSHSIQNFINNRLPVFDYAYHHKVSPLMQMAQYQAIMPIPYFNTGSEAYWHDAVCPTLIKSYALALYTGLPLNAVNMSRTSISQCVKNLQLIWEPYRDYPVIKDYKQDKYIMLYVDTTCERISENEKMLVLHSKYIDTLWGFQIRRISLTDFSTLLQKNREKLLSLSNSSPYILKTYDSLPSNITYLGPGSLEIRKKQASLLFKGNLFAENDTTYFISFWVYGMDKDMISRNVLEVAIGSQPDNWFKVDYFSFKDIIKTMDRGWGLLEFTINTKSPKDYISLAILTPPLGTPTYYIDNLMIRSGNVVINSGKEILVNNRLIMTN